MIYNSKDNFDLKSGLKLIEKLDFSRPCNSNGEQKAMELLRYELDKLSITSVYHYFDDWWIKPVNAFLYVVDREIPVKPAVPLSYLKNNGKWMGIENINFDLSGSLYFNKEVDCSYENGIVISKSLDKSLQLSNAKGQILTFKEDSTFIPYIFAKEKFIPSVYIDNKHLPFLKKNIGSTCKLSWESQQVTRTFKNLVATIKGNRENEKCIVIGAHLDSYPGTVGASDNASGVSILIEIAKWFYNNPPEKTVHLVFFTGEELDRRGSIHYVKDYFYNSTKPDLFINVDSGVLQGSGSVYIRYTSNENSKSIKKNLSTDLEIVEKATTHADVEAFQKENIPTFWACANSPRGPHLPTDTVEEIDKKNYKKIGDITLKTTIFAANVLFQEH